MLPDPGLVVPGLAVPLRLADHRVETATVPLNGSLCEHKGQLYIVYRLEHHSSKYRVWGAESTIWIVPVQHLGGHVVEPVGYPRRLLLPVCADEWPHRDIMTHLGVGTWPRFELGTRVEDPRAVSDGEALLLTYTDGYGVYEGRVNPETCEVLKASQFNSPSIKQVDSDSREKNWVPLVRPEGTYYFYAVRDGEHWVLGEESEYVTWARTPIWLRVLGGFRHGAPPVRWSEGELLVIGHTCREGKYTAVWYRCQAEPPFEITTWCTRPLLALPGEDEGGMCGSRPVVYPAGCVTMGNNFLLSYGLNDRHVCTVLITRGQFQ